MNSCPNCHQSLHVSSCHQASLLYCSDCQWGLISFDEEIENLMEMETDMPRSLLEADEASLVEAVTV